MPKSKRRKGIPKGQTIREELAFARNRPADWHLSNNRKLRQAKARRYYDPGAHPRPVNHAKGRRGS